METLETQKKGIPGLCRKIEENPLILVAGFGVLLYFLCMFAVHTEQVYLERVISDAKDHLNGYLNGATYSINNYLYGYPYRFFAWLGGSLGPLLGFSYEDSRSLGGAVGFSLVQSLFQTAEVFSCACLLNRLVNGEARLRKLNSTVLLFALACCVETAIWYPPLHAYYGTIMGTPDHNSTYSSMMAFALPAFLLFLNCWEGRKIPKTGTYLAYVITLTLSTACKPNYIFAFAPLLLCLLIVDFVKTRGRRFGYEFLMGAACLPGIAICFVQLGLLFPSGGEAGGIAIGLFELSKGGRWYLIVINLLRSLAFPLYALIFLTDRKHHTEVSLSWLLYLTTRAEFDLFYETGPRKYHGNFGWGGMTAFFCVYTVSVGMLIRRFREDGKLTIRNTVGGILFLWHTLCGIGYVYYLMQGGVFL